MGFMFMDKDAVIIGGAKGIGSCWVNYFKPSEVKEAFNLPENETPVLLMTLGYPADDSKPIKLHYESKDMTEIVKIL